MLIPDRLSALQRDHDKLLVELEQAKTTIKVLEANNLQLWDALAARRREFDKLLASLGDAAGRAKSPAALLTIRDWARSERARRDAIDVEIAKARLAEMAAFINPDDPPPEPEACSDPQPDPDQPTHEKPIPLRALSLRGQDIGLLTR